MLPCGCGSFGSEKVEVSERERKSSLVLRWREYAFVAVVVGVATEMCEAVWEIT